MSDSDVPYVTLRTPHPADAPAVWQLVRDSGILDTNSLYYYNLWFRDFAGTSVVATTETGRIIGFITAYIRPSHPDTLMAWQSAVDPGRKSPGLAVRMMHEIADRAARYGASCVETTINPGNRAVALMLRRFAHERGLDIHTEVLFTAEDFPAEEGAHPPEVLYRMMPATPSRAGSFAAVAASTR